MISIKNLSYKVKNKEILKDITFDISENKITGIIGKNGSGKTTLIKHISRTIKSKNSIFIDGLEINSYSNKLFSKKIAVVYQDYEQVGDFTVNDLILMGRYPYKKMFGSYRDKDIEIVDKIIKDFDLEHIKESKLNTISGGELQLSFIARAFVQETPIIVLDEPINHLDIDYQIRLMNILKAMKDKTIIITIHNLDIALRFCDDIVIMESGRVFANGRTDEILNNENIRNVFNVDSKIVEIDNKKIIVYK